MIHYISFFDPPWHNECDVATALELHGYEVSRCQVTDPLDRPGIADKPQVKDRDLILTSVPHRVPLAELREYKARGAILACWYWDWIFGLGNREAAYLPALLLMDAVFSSAGFCGAAYIRRHVNCRHYLPQCAVPRTSLAPPDRRTKKHDIVFLGHLWTPDRKELARRLRHRWDFANVGFGPRVWGRELADVCQSTSIMIGTNYRNDVAGYWSDRCYVTMGAGGFYLGQHVKGLERVFQNGVHCGFFYGLDDMEVKVDWWLKHPAELEACRQRGHALVQEKHTYTQRVRDLLSALQSRQLLK